MGKEGVKVRHRPEEKKGENSGRYRTLGPGKKVPHSGGFGTVCGGGGRREFFIGMGLTGQTGRIERLMKKKSCLFQIHTITSK